MYYETHTVFSSTKLRIYDKDKRKQVKVVLLYKSVTNLNTLLFNHIMPKIGHSQVGQTQVMSRYIHVVAQ